MQSGSSLSPWAHSKRTKELTYDIARTLNIDNSTSENLVEGLKSVDANKLQNVAYRKFQEVRDVKTTICLWYYFLFSISEKILFTTE